MLEYRLVFSIITICFFIVGILANIKSYTIDSDYNNYVVLSYLNLGISAILAAIIFKPIKLENSG